jgi:hypothetical protein
MNKFHLASLPGALVLSLLSACSDDSARDRSARSTSEPALLESALEAPILSCQRERLSCRRDAEDRAGREACDSDLASCLRSAAERAEAAADALLSCREEARDCLRDGDERGSCIEEFERCSRTALSEDDDRDAGEDVPSDDGDDDESSEEANDAGVSEPSDAGDQRAPSRPRLPGVDLLPSVDAGALIDQLPKPLACTTKLRLCVARDPLQALECADTARSCLSER